MKKSLYLLLTLFFFFGLLSLTLIFAQNEKLAGINYPVAELGNCASEQECMVYCDNPENMASCLDFAEENNLLAEEEITMARKMLEVGETGGPGGCQGQEECENYCDEISHIKECVAFAEEHDLIAPEELAEAKKVLTALDKGVQAPPCNSKSECDIVCSKPENMKTCITFAKEADLMPPEELEEAEKVLAAIEKGVQPPSCGRKKECDVYCAEPEHLEECLTFAEAAGFISEEEAEMARKTGGRGPGDCRGKAECEAYCEDPEHGEECINFAVENGFMPEEEAEDALKMLKAGLTSGPGGCKGKEECEVYCNDLTHTEECIDFAVKAGFMDEEEAEEAKKMSQMGVREGPGGCQGQEECESYCENPDNMEECLEFAEKTGMMMPEETEKAKEMTEMMMRGGPGGCGGEEECKDYCDDPANMEECLNFAESKGIMPQEKAEKIREMMDEGESGMEGFPMSPPEGLEPPEGMLSPTGFPPGLEGKCTNAQDCVQYCVQNFQDSACQEIMGKMPGEQLPFPSFEEPQSFFEKTKNFLASLISFFQFKK